MELESLIRENRGLQGSIQIIQKGVMDSVGEINRYKESYT